MTPFRLVYEDLASDRPGTIRAIIDLLGVNDDQREEVELPPVEKQSDGTNKEWITRFEAEAAGAREPGDTAGSGGENVLAGPGAFTGPTAAPASSGGLYDQFINKPPTGTRPSAAYVETIRARHLFNVFVEQNSSLFENARVLDFPSIDGRWGLAALDAGAAYVVGVEPVPRLAARATTTFVEYGVSQDLYEFINADVYASLEGFEPETFDLITCVRFFERFDLRRVFRELHRLRPRFVILDTAIAPGRGPILRFALRMPEISGSNAARYASVGNLVATPSQDLIAFMCNCYGFQCHNIDWHTLGITDWIGIHEYERGQRRTFLLEWIG